MKPISSSVTKGISTGSRIECIDNSGAKILEVIAVKTYGGVKRRHPSAGVAGVVVCSVKRGTPKIRHEVVLAVIVRQKKEWRRADGRRIKFDSNAAVLINDRGEPRGSEIKGAIAKEVVERFPAVGKIATVVI